MSIILAVIVDVCGIYKFVYVGSNVWCYKCVKTTTIDDITMTECCMIMMGFGQVWEHDNHALNVMGLRGYT